MKRSDLFCENAVISNKNEPFSVHNSTLHGTDYTIYKGKDGSYTHYTVFTGKGNMKLCLYEIFRSLLPDGSAFVTGLGNSSVCSDSLGCKTLNYVPATAHLSVHRDFNEMNLRRVFVSEAGVTGKTGMESSDRTACLAAGCKADFIVAVDSLACSSVERLCSTIQISDTGISPGSGVGNNRRAMNRETCGIPVYAVGVPTVIDLDSFTDYSGGRLMVSPRNIDELTDSFAKTIGTALSCALNPTLSESEIMSLVIR